MPREALSDNYRGRKVVERSLLETTDRMSRSRSETPDKPADQISDEIARLRLMETDPRVE